MKEEMNLSEKVKEIYVKPSVEVIEMEMEGILCTSGPTPIAPPVGPPTF